MKKNRYNFPQQTSNYMEDGFNVEEYPQAKRKSWRNNGITDIYHDEIADGQIHQDPYTVAQHFYDRTTMPY